MSWARYLEELDPRWIYLLVFIVIAIPILIPMPSPLAITQYTGDAFETIENLPPGSLVVLSFDYSGANPELHPQAIAVMRHVIKRPLYVMIVGMWSDGPIMAHQIWKTIDKTGYDPENPSQIITKEYGKHIVNLGYLATTALIVGMYDSITENFSEDFYGNPVTELPLIQKFDGIKHAAVVVSFAAGSPGPGTYLQYWATQKPEFHKFIVGSPAVSAPGFMPYYEAGKAGEIGYVGVIVSLRGAAEYETLLGEIGLTGATAALNAQSAVHYLLVIAVVLGNIAYFMRKYGGEER